MEKLMLEIEAHAKAIGVKPATVLQKYAGYGGTVWKKWQEGEAQCTLSVAEKIRTQIKLNAPRGMGNPSYHSKQIGNDTPPIQGGRAKKVNEARS